jgi:hypothetical protein
MKRKSPLALALKKLGGFVRVSGSHGTENDLSRRGIKTGRWNVKTTLSRSIRVYPFEIRQHQFSIKWLQPLNEC